jgi:hypothetical protein
MNAGIVPPARGINPPRSTLALCLALIAAAALFAYVAYIVQITVGAQPPRPGAIIPTFFDRNLLIIFFSIPYVAALILLVWTPHPLATAAGGGIAFAFFGAIALYCIGMFLTVFVWAGLSRNALLFHALGAVVLLFLVSLFIVIASAFQLRQSSVAFAVAACITAAYITAGVSKIRLHSYRVEQKSQRSIEATNTALVGTHYNARTVVARLAACLIEYHQTHPRKGFPSSLSALPPELHLPQGASCDPALASPGHGADYTFTYTPEADPSAGAFNDFRLLAMPVPAKKGLPYLDPILVDSRGRIFVYVGWSVGPNKDSYPAIIETPDDFRASQIFGLRYDLKTFLEKNNGAPPATLSALFDKPQANAANDPDTDREGAYELKYISPAHAGPVRFAVSSTCQSYGDQCIRSFLLTPDLEIHQTSEPRLATAKDPPIPDCEKYAQTCRDIDWPMP